jgi:hypothetical protein
MNMSYEEISARLPEQFRSNSGGIPDFCIPPQTSSIAQCVIRDLEAFSCTVYPNRPIRPPFVYAPYFWTLGAGEKLQQI